MSQSVIVRTATADDASAIVGVQRAAGRGSGNEQSMETAIHDAHRLVVVALAEGRVVGWAKTHHWKKTDGAAPAGHYLGGVDVAPGHRRRGVGTALTGARLDWIWLRSADAWYVVNVQNQASIDLHHRWNFVEVARGPRFHSTTFIGTGLLMHAQRPCATSGGQARLNDGSLRN